MEISGLLGLSVEFSGSRRRVWRISLGLSYGEVIYGISMHPVNHEVPSRFRVAPKYYKTI